MTEKPTEDIVEEEYADLDDDPDTYTPEEPVSDETHTVYDKDGEVAQTPHDEAQRAEDPEL